VERDEGISAVVVPVEELKVDLPHLLLRQPELLPIHQVLHHLELTYHALHTLRVHISNLTQVL
jgi:hypothetical protein